MSDEVLFLVESILGMDTGKALVRITFGKTAYTLTVQDASAFAANLIRGIEASQQDLQLYRYLTENVGSTHQDAALMIRGVREFRKGVTSG